MVGIGRVAVIGLGYVGLPLAIALARRFLVVGFDRDPVRVSELGEGIDRTGEADSETLRATTIEFTDDPARMAELVSPEFVLFYMDREKAHVGARGAQELREQMHAYFGQFPDVRSELSGLSVTGAFVTCAERAHWTAGGRMRTQSSAAVFEVRDGRIHRTWYFPAQP